MMLRFETGTFPLCGGKSGCTPKRTVLYWKMYVLVIPWTHFSVYLFKFILLFICEDGILVMFLIGGTKYLTPKT